MTNQATRARAVACGLIGGTIGVAAMNASMKRSSKLLRIEATPSRRTLREGESPDDHDSASAALGRVLYENLTGKQPSERTQQRLSTAVHWGYGIASGAFFGLLRGSKRWLITDAVGGATYGVGLWVLRDMFAIPRLGIADKPALFELRKHVHALSGHVVYGLATAAGTRVAHRLLG
jgi:hypothetical protein